MIDSTIPIAFRQALARVGVDPDVACSVFRSPDGAEHVEALYRCHPHNGSPPLLVGEAPGPKGDPTCPLFPLPRNCAGGRLMRVMGVDLHDYLYSFRRVNLLDYYPGSRWRKADQERAAAAAASIKTMARQLGLVVLCGANVAKACGHDAEEFEVLPAGRRGRAGYRVVRVPHPSGRNRRWNDPATRESMRTLVRDEMPWMTSRMESD